MNRTIPYIFLVVVFSIYTQTLFSQIGNTSDSLSLSLRGLNKKERLKTLAKNASAENLSSIEMLEKEAESQNDNLRLAQAYYLKRVYYDFIDGTNDSLSNYYEQQASAQLNILQHQLDKLDRDELREYNDVKTNIMYGIVASYLANNKSELALTYVYRMLETAEYDEASSTEYNIYALLGVCYTYARKSKEAFDSFKKGYELYMKNAKTNDSYDFYRFLEGMSYACLKQKDYEQVLILNDSLENMLVRRYERTSSEQYPYYIAKFSSRYNSAYAFLGLKDLSKARKMLNEARDYALSELKSTPFLGSYYEIETRYHLAAKNYDRAREFMNLFISWSSQKSKFQNPFQSVEMNLLKAEVLNESGSSKEAYKLLSELYQLKDSLTATNFSEQVAEIQTIYKVDKLEYEAEQNRLKMQAFFYVLIGSVLVSLLLIYIVYASYKNGKILKNKNKRLLQQYSEIESRNKIIQNLELERHSDIESGKIGLDPYQELVLKLDLYLVDTQEYRKPKLTREELALAIGTNRQYLIEAIKTVTGKTFNEYIYTFRLKYAYDLIVNERDKPIIEVCLEAGFQTKGTFNREFKEAFGLTPSELRNATT